MNPEDVGRILDEIGERIGPAGEYAWQLTVRQVYLEGILGTLIGGLVTAVLLVVTIGVPVYARRLYLRAKASYANGTGDPYRYNRPSADNYGFPAGLVAMVSGFGFMFTGAWTYWSALMLLNPEYHAMVRLLERIVP